MNSYLACQYEQIIFYCVDGQYLYTQSSVGLFPLFIYYNAGMKTLRSLFELLPFLYA